MNIEENRNRIWRFVPAITVILGIFLLAQTFNILKSNEFRPAQNVITVSGSGEVFSAPDVATFTFSVTAEGKDVKEAQTKVSEKIDSALNAVKALGVEEKDIKTIDYNAYPKYEYTNSICTAVYPSTCPPSKQVLVGYEVTQSISVKVRKVDDAGKMLEAVANAKVTNVSGLSFTIDDEEALQREARQKAINDAKDKANRLAKDLGVRIVRIVSFSESGYPMPMYYGADMGMGGMGLAEAKATPSVPSGENKITSNVSITYEIR